VITDAPPSFDDTMIDPLPADTGADLDDGNDDDGLDD
jgi:hypothetical protein